MKTLLKLAVTISLTSHLLTAYSLPTSYTVIAPECLAKNLQEDSKPLATSNHFSLLQLNRQELDALIAAKHEKPQGCGGFLNVSPKWQANSDAGAAKAFLEKNLLPPAPPAPISTHPSKYSIQYTTQVNQLMAQLDPDAMWANLTTLTAFPDRFSDSDTGVAAEKWIKSQIETLIKNSGRTDVTIRSISTGSSYKQNSIVVKIGNSNANGIVLGAHMDTLNGVIPKVQVLHNKPGGIGAGGYNATYSESLPGADDDGSGTVTVLEIAKVLLNSQLQFNKPIYLIWYAAEEEGLIGSGFTVQDFVIKKIGVDAVIQFDMTGFAYQNEPTMWLMKDYTDPALTAFLQTLITTYVKQPVKYTACGYACSDHASWSMHGYKAVFASEAEMSHDNSYFHTTQDTMEKLSLTHMTDFAKLGVAFAIELAGVSTQ